MNKKWEQVAEHRKRRRKSRDGDTLPAPDRSPPDAKDAEPKPRRQPLRERR